MTEAIALREQWLVEAVRLLQPLYEENGYTVPPVRVSCSWPSRGGRPGPKQRLGECWASTQASDGIPQIFITPLYSDSENVLAVLVHEIAHAVAGPDAHHKGPFVKIIRAIGLEGKPTATHAGEALKCRLNSLVVAVIGAYPHAQLTWDANRKVARTRLLKAECQDCGCTFRITQKWIDEASEGFHCPIVGCDGEVGFGEKD